MSDDLEFRAGQGKMPSGDDCERLRLLLPAYAIGATDPKETHLVQSLLRQCPEVAAELSDYAALSEGLLYATDPVEPSASLKQQMLSRARASSAEPQDIKAEPAGLYSLPTRRSSRYRWPLIAAILILVLIGTNVFWVLQVGQLRQQQIEILTNLNRRETLLTAFGQGTTRRVELVSTDTNAVATVYWSPTASLGVLYATDFPPLTTGQTYQLWLIEGEQTLSAGLFDVGGGGEGGLIFEPPVAIDEVAALGITAEPAGGSPAPTSPPLVVGQVSV